jgi:hypothetical protein
MTMVVGMFDNLVEVQRAVADLIAAGYGRNTISILVRDGHADGVGVRQGFEAPADDDDPAAIHAESHAAQGAVDITRAARILAGGPLATALRQSSREHPDGPVVRALTSAGLGLMSARYFTDAICQGAVMVAVHCEDRYVRDTRDLLDAHANPAPGSRQPARESRALAAAS